MHCGVSISQFVLIEPDSIQFCHDIILCYESDSIGLLFFIKYQEIERRYRWVSAKDIHVIINFESSSIVTEEV